MSTLTKEAIKRVLGPVDHSLSAELVSAGATEAELREAKAWVTNDETLVNELRTLPTGRVAELIQFLDRLAGPEIGEE